MNKIKKSELIGIKVTEETRKKLEKIAEQRSCSISAVVRSIVDNTLNIV